MIKWLRRSSDSTRSVESTWVNCRHVGAALRSRSNGSSCKETWGKTPSNFKVWFEHGSHTHTHIYILYTWIWRRILRPAWACIWNLLRIELGSALSRDKAAAGKAKKRRAGQIPCQRANSHWIVAWVSLKQLLDALGKLFGPIAVGLLCWYCRWNWPTD